MTGGDDARRTPLPVDLDRLLHDLRGPLNAVVMHLEVLKRLLGDDPVGSDSLQSIQREVERLTAMLPVAIAICALERGPLRRVSLRAVVASAVDDAARKRIVIEPGTWPDVDGDEALLVEGVRQLVRNALESTSGDGDVRIAAEESADTVAVVVRDSGAGFGARNTTARIRLMAGTKPGHLGVGLLIAQRVARLHGGGLSFGTGDGGGEVRFTVRRRPVA